MWYIVIKHSLSMCLQTQMHSPRRRLRCCLQLVCMPICRRSGPWHAFQLRHIGALLRVTLYRRFAELSFRGVDFCQLPREVMKDICHDFDNICGEMAKRLASLFAFLKPASTNAKHSDPMGQLLYADPGYWLYGLLSFCAKACESKTAEANGAPVHRAKDERGARA